MKARAFEVECERCSGAMFCEPGDEVGVLINRRTRLLKGFLCSGCCKQTLNFVDEFPDWQVVTRAFPKDQYNAQG